MVRLVIFCVLLLSACSFEKKDNRSRSAHFRDGKFHNFIKGKKKNWFGFLKVKLTRNWASWPDWVETEQVEAVKDRVNSGDVEITFINHASFLIQTDGLNILTDPIFSKRCSPVSFAGPKRVHRPGIDFNKLPKIDVVIISHDHYDHLDLETISKLIEIYNPKLFMGLGVAERLDSADNVTELDWWESVTPYKDFKLTFVPVQHFSGRTLTDRFSTLWGGFVLEIGDKKIYFGGDSGYAGHYKKTFDRFGAMDISFLPIGAYAPRDFMSYAHMDPGEAVKAHIDLKSKLSIGMHYGTFQLTAEKREEPQKLLRQERDKAEVGDSKFITLELGKTLKVSP